MKRLVTVAVGLLALAPASGVAAPSMEAAVIRELNFARTQPQAYAQTLRRYREAFNGRVVNETGQGPGLLTFEGAAPVDEAIAFLERQPPLEPLETSDALARAADDHLREQGRSGATGHRGADGSTPVMRIERYGRWRGRAAESISYGQDTAAGVVRQLIVDDGVANRPHRATVFSGGLGRVGAACGPHPRHGASCVLDFAAQMDPPGS